MGMMALKVCALVVHLYGVEPVGFYSEFATKRSILAHEGTSQGRQMFSFLAGHGMTTWKGVHE